MMQMPFLKLLSSVFFLQLLINAEAISPQVRVQMGIGEKALQQSISTAVPSTAIAGVFWNCLSESILIAPDGTIPPVFIMSAVLPTIPATWIHLQQSTGNYLASPPTGGSNISLNEVMDDAISGVEGPIISEAEAIEYVSALYRELLGRELQLALEPDTRPSFIDPLTSGTKDKTAVRSLLDDNVERYVRLEFQRFKGRWPTPIEQNNYALMLNSGTSKAAVSSMIAALP